MIKYISIFLLFICFIACGESKTDEMMGEIIALTNHTGDDYSWFELDSLAEGEIIDENVGQGLDFFNPIGVIGNGVVMVEPYIQPSETEVIHFEKLSIYNDSACRELYSRYNFFHYDSLPKGKNIVPLYNNAEYGFYAFVLIDENTDSYQIAINKEGRKYVKKEQNIKAYNWKEFFERVFFIGTSDKNPLRSAPDDKSPVLNPDKYNNEDNIDIYSEREVEVHGEWLKMTYPLADNEEYWIRWRRGNDIIIEIYISI